ncbi:monovalent cation/H+ antiporter complex subunit F [Gordonia hankookensis]|uniref:Cation:proton antiporter n=1 Tax=Gordonia hankookensis TaxID=589403 RepID=A0ABR7WAM6_9ACTN|nr:monovalent cation/H+ antiporter complex subunit F [Gordonia hankookensis]MBD1319853.1 cation:proton antiporter [Gordonia hankookensis]NDZ95030.1 cation:proton antiporter [Streptomyces sp. SID11726]NEB24168.1 cation:proton antiporter [Streptomyces sp. SID6673]
MTYVWVIVSAMLMIAAVLTTIRVLRGPTTLDRLVALDTVIALCMCGLGAWAAYSRDSTVVPAIVALSLVSFVGSVAIARFRVRDDET